MSQIQVVPSGEYVTPLWPNKFTPQIEDIAYHLAGINRFNGGTRYTVAQHCVHVADEVICSGHGEHALWGLLHDAPEYVLGDLAHPLKYHPFFGEAYRDVERALMRRICYVFGLPSEMPPSVLTADRRLAVTERRDLMPEDPEWTRRSGWREYRDVVPLGERIVAWPASVAEAQFLGRFRAYRLEEAA